MQIKDKITTDRKFKQVFSTISAFLTYLFLIRIMDYV